MVFSFRRLTLGTSFLGSREGLIAVIFTSVRHRRRRIVGREWNVYVLLRWSGRQGSPSKVNHRQRKSRLHLDRLLHGVHFLTNNGIISSTTYVF
jgi:hypothetical protein